MKKSLKILVLLLIIFVVSIISLGYVWHKIKPVYYAEDFGIEVVKSEKDNNNNGVDDYIDIVLGARKDAENKPQYKSAYYSGGYPPENEGVCTDVIWRAFLNAGYFFKDMVDNDIKENLEEYTRITTPDPNIDFRRVPNLQVFFKRNAISLTTDPYDISKWQAGDIVIFGNSHIAIVSDKRNKDGITYIIHNAGQQNREEDALLLWNIWEPITGHYRMAL